MGVYIEKNKRTKESIQKAFIKILEKKTFEAITIGDISKLANINRGTFYKHYIDKFDLLEQMEQQLFSDLGKHIDQLQSHYLEVQTLDKIQEEIAIALFGYIETNASYLKIFLSNQGRAGFHFRFRDALSKKVQLKLESSKEFNKDLNAPFDYYLSFITSAFLGLIEQWVQKGLKKNPQEMTQIYIDIISFIRKK